jgi:hypothetical protein
MACKKSPKRQRKMSKGQRRAVHGPPRTHQKRGRAATQSHHANPNEKRRSRGTRHTASSRHARTRTWKIPIHHEPKAKDLRLRISYKCDKCKGKLESEGQYCNKQVPTDYYPYSRQCEGHAVRHEEWV